MSKHVQSTQVHIAPGIYGGLTAVGSFYFILTGNILITCLIYLFIILVCYTDKPFKELLLNKKNRIVIFSSLIISSIILPLIPKIIAPESLAKFVSLVLTPIIGIVLAIFVAKVYSIKNISRIGWEIDKNKK